MSLGIFSPYGRASGETGFLMVLSRYLLRRGYGMVQLRCNGILPTCGRDSLKPGGRQLMSCVDCMIEQDQGVRWSELPTIDLSRSLRSGDFSDLQRALARCSLSELEQYSIDGILVGPLTESIVANISTDRDDQGLGEFRSAVLLTARTITAFLRLTQEHQFDGMLTPVGDDFYLKCFAAVVERRGIKHFRFKWDAASLSMRVFGALSGQEFRSNLFFDDVSAMRSNVDSWPDEIQDQLKAVESYLGITQQQLSLPII